MLICALSVTPVLLVPQIESLWVAVLLIGLAAAAHQGWSANVFTLVSDSFPRQAVGSVVGIGGMAGARRRRRVRRRHRRAAPASAGRSTPSTS